jgi:hypothetical protein
MILFRKNYSEWFDVGCYNKAGHYYLLQMCYHLKTNKKVFRNRRMGFINNYNAEKNLFSTTLNINKS